MHKQDPAREIPVEFPGALLQEALLLEQKITPAMLRLLRDFLSEHSSLDSDPEKSQRRVRKLVRREFRALQNALQKHGPADLQAFGSFAARRPRPYHRKDGVHMLLLRIEARKILIR